MQIIPSLRGDIVRLNHALKDAEDKSRLLVILDLIYAQQHLNNFVGRRGTARNVQQVAEIVLRIVI